MESTRPIRALVRGLDALTILNSRDAATVSEVAHEIRLPRTTVYRILETLCDAGFVVRDASDDRYRLTILVKALSGGFDDDAWVTQIAKPFILELGAEIVWPVSIATLSGSLMMVRESTDHSSPLATERYSAGCRASLLGSSSGRAYLANCPAPQRDALIDVLARSKREEDHPARARAELLQLLGTVKSQGFAALSRTRRLAEELSLSVPVLQADRVLGSLTVRFAAASIPVKNGIERFFPTLRG